jgi:PAS domain S-box-containing protein
LRVANEISAVSAITKSIFRGALNMSSEGDEDIFIEKMEMVSHRTEELVQNIKEIPWQRAQLLIACLNDLQLALEELQIAEEELRQQNEELMEARQATEVERQRYQELFEFAPDGYLVTDMYGVIREANLVAAQLLNIAQNHLIGKLIISFVPEEHRRVFRSMLNQLHTMSRLQEWEVSLSRHRGELFDAALTVQTVRDQQGQAIALRWLLRDITARKQAEEQLCQTQLQNLQLGICKQIISQFVGCVRRQP